METSTNTIDEKTLFYLDTYAFEKKMLIDPAQWIADQVKNGKRIGHWLDGFRIHGKENEEPANIESLWQAVTYFCHEDLEAFVIGQTAYSIPADAREALQLIKKNDLGALANQSPNTAFALNLYGKYFASLDQASEAARFFSEALKLCPQFCEPYNNLGQLMWKVGQQKEAFVLFSQALSKNPHLLSAQLNFFDAGLELEEYESILNVINYLESEIPECTEFQYYKAICKHKSGHKEEAKAILRGILKEQPDDPEARQLLEHYSV